MYGVARIVFGAEPSDEEILRFVTSKWEKALVLWSRFDRGEQAHEEPQATRPRGGENPQADGNGHQGAADTRKPAGRNETGVGLRKKPAPRGRGGGVLQAAEVEAQAEASWALIAICSKPYTKAVPVPPETGTAIYCAARQQPISIPKQNRPKN